MKKDIGTPREEAKKNDSDALLKQTSDEISIDSPVHQEEAKKFDVKRTPPVKTAINKDEFISEKESNVSHIPSDSKKPSILEKTIIEPIISSAESASSSKVKKPRVSSGSKPKKVSQAVPLSDVKSKDLTIRKFVMIETKQEKITTLDDATTSKQKRVRSAQSPAKVIEPIIQVETRK